jgi:hypothetical protein
MMTMTLMLTLLAATPWEQSFEPVAVGSYLDRPNAAVLVVTAGDVNEEARAAEDALVKALRASGQTRLVMTGESVAVRAGDRDEDVVKKASVLPVDLIIVQRVFPGGGSNTVAVATLYDKSGSSVSAIAATSGQPVQRRASSSRVVAGRGAVSEVIQAQRPREEEAPSKPDPRKITYAAGALVNVQSGQVVSTWITPYFNGKPLTGERFYEVVGKPDLAETYRRRMGTRVGLMVGGGVATVGGVAVALATMMPKCAVFDGRSSTCIQEQFPNLVAPGLVIGALGLTTFLVGALLRADPVGPAEAYQLSEDYNRKVDGGVKVSAAVVPTPNGVNATLAVRF